MFRVPDPAWPAALRELERVHRSDQARLLREACALACAGTPLGRLYVAGFEHARCASSREEARAAWDLACVEEIDTARADAFQVERLLPRLLDLRTERWPRPAFLARAALALKPCQAGRVDLARARIAEGDLARAIGELRILLGQEPAPAVRADALEALAMALEGAGDRRASLACYAAASVEDRSDPRIPIALLALALRVGDRDKISLAVRRLARLDLSVAGTRRRFERALCAARGRAERDRRGEPRAADARVGRVILEMALAGPGACAEVARGLT